MRGASRILFLNFLKDIVSPDYGVLNIGAGLAFKTQCLLEVKRDHRISSVLEQEIAKGTHSNRCSNSFHLGFVEINMTIPDFLERLLQQRVNQVIGLDAQPL